MDNSSNASFGQKRLFIGIKISSDKNLLRDINNAKAELKESLIKWALCENYHITLRFLGNTPNYYLNSIKLIVKQAVLESEPFSIELKSLGTFGKSEPKILWIGVKENKALQIIYRRINKDLETIGFAFPNQLYNPHLTLGRIKEIEHPEAIENLIRKSQEKTYQKSLIREINIFESVLSENGPIYTVLHSESFE